MSDKVDFARAERSLVDVNRDVVCIKASQNFEEPCVVLGASTTADENVVEKIACPLAASKNLSDDALKAGWRAAQSERKSLPLKQAPRCHHRRDVTRGGLEWDLQVAPLQVQFTEVLSSSEELTELFDCR